MGADWSAARLVAPVEEYDSDRWRQHWIEHPDDFLQVLGDMYRVYKSEEAKRNGTANPQGGRRRATIDGNAAELWSLVTPRFSIDPFPEAFAEIRGNRSIRQIAMRAGLVHTSLLRYLGRGKERLCPTRHEYECIAKALDVHPAYFREWRELVIADFITRLLAERPNMSITLLKAIS